MEGEQVRKTKTTAKIAGLLTLGCLFAGLAVMPVFGASRKRISSVNIEVEAEIQPETRIGEETIEVNVKGGKYYYDYYDVENDGFEWEENDIPKISIYLRAEAGYYFSLTKASSVKLSGATYVKATKEDSSETLKLTVKLPSLAETVGDQSDVTLTNNGYAIWKEVRGAGSYEVRLYRNGEGVGATMLTTTDPHYNFQSAMTKPGDYQVKVRPVNKVNQDNKGTWKESTVITLSSEDASRIRNGEGGGMPVTGEWVSDQIGWWYKHSDKTYTKNGWEEIDGKWYFFGEDGYMKTGWIDWNGKKYYCDKNGVMLTNTTTPDGTILGYDGTPKTD